jgi:hypothetical protein
MIDVKTAKIVKVVSVDVKGDIEDVVGRLTNISELLVGAQQAPTSSLNEVPPAIVERKKVEPKEEPVKVEKAELEKPREENNNAVVSYEDEDSWKNKNRSGIRVSWNMLLGPYSEKDHYIDYTYYGVKTNDNTYPVDDSSFTSVTKPHFSTLQLAFSIKAGSFLTIDVGPGWSSAQMNRTRELGYYIGDSLATWTYDLNIFSILTGINFTKRWYPFKLNLGLFFNANYLNYAKHYVETSYNNYYLTSDTTYYFHAFNVSYGLRTGMEYLIGKHIGINVDLDFCYSEFETMAETDYNNDGSYYDYSRIITTPPIGLGIGLNFYY